MPAVPDVYLNYCCRRRYLDYVINGKVPPPGIVPHPPVPDSPEFGIHSFGLRRYFDYVINGKTPSPGIVPHLPVPGSPEFGLLLLFFFLNIQLTDCLEYKGVTSAHA